MADRTWTDEDLADAVMRNITISGVLRALCLTTSPGNFRTFHVHRRRLGLDTSHFKGKAHLAGRAHPHKRSIPLPEILVKNSTYTNMDKLKKRLLREGLLSGPCSECGTDSEWQGKPLTLQIDHINGDPQDHRLGNLRLLCPNCHSQTLTFTGRSRGRYQAKKERCVCIDCGKETSGIRWKRCPSCAPKESAKTKINWPPDNELVEMARGRQVEATGRILGVSGNAVKKRLKKKGYWPLP